jgi:hypothetical protein
MLVIKKSAVLLPLIILPIFGSSADSAFIKSPKTAFIASVIPGGGQIYNGKLIKGLAIMTLEVMALQLWRENSDIYSGYDSGDYRLAKGRYLEKRNKYAWWVVFLYFYSMIDAMVDAHLSPFNEVMDANIDIEEEKGVENE